MKGVSLLPLLFSSFVSHLSTEELNHAQDEFNTQAGLTVEQLEKIEAEALEEERHRAEYMPKGTKAPEDDSQGKTAKEKRQWKIRAIQSAGASAVGDLD